MSQAHMTRSRQTAWVGWLWFAAIMIIIAGSFNAIYGLVALFKDEYYTISRQGLLVFDLTAWGWILLLFGVLAVATGFALFSGPLWARIGAVALAALNVLAHMAFMSAYPVWALIAITVDVL